MLQVCSANTSALFICPSSNHSGEEFSFLFFFFSNKTDEDKHITSTFGEKNEVQDSKETAFFGLLLHS